MMNLSVMMFNFENEILHTEACSEWNLLLSSIICMHVLNQINVKEILAVINATYAVAKRKPEKIRLAGIRTLTSAIPVQRSNQLS